MLVVGFLCVDDGTTYVLTDTRIGRQHVHHDAFLHQSDSRTNILGTVNCRSAEAMYTFDFATYCTYCAMNHSRALLP